MNQGLRANEGRNTAIPPRNALAEPGNVTAQEDGTRAGSSQDHRPDAFQRSGSTIYFQPAEALYDQWPAPVCIIADGPYGLGGFPGDLHTANGLVDWYRPHVEAWAARSTPETTLWFWNSELGWATVHPLLAKHGWEYRSCHIWDKGLGHIAGNANTRTLRKFPVVTEVCVQYVKAPTFQSNAGEKLTMQDWLRHEWRRSGLPLRLANEACGVANAATRKYLTADHLWYYPPPDAFIRLAAYANKHGDASGKPYFSQDGHRPITAEQWARMRAKFRCPAGVTNVWRRPQVAGKQRINGDRQQMQWKYKSLHGSQKPLEFIETAILTTTDPGDAVWEPFGGLCPAAICAFRLDRVSHSAEIVSEFYNAAVERLDTWQESRDLLSE